MSALSKLITVKEVSTPGSMGDITTIPLTKGTRDRLRALGKKGETYDDLLNRMMDVYVNRTVEFETVR